MSALPESLVGDRRRLGGTGPQGRGLARRFAAAGLPVVIGSRSQERAQSTAATLAGRPVATSPVRRTRRPRRRATSWSPPSRGGPRQAPRGPHRAGWPAGPRRLREPARLRQAGCLRPAGRGRARPRSRPSAAARLDGRRRLPQRQRGSPSRTRGRDRWTPTCSCSATSGRPPTWSRTWPVSSPASGVFGGRLRNAHQVEGAHREPDLGHRRYRAHAGIRITDI